MAIVKHMNQVRELTVSIKTSVSFLNLCVWAGGFCRKVCKSVPMLMKDGKSLKKKSGSKVYGGGHLQMALSLFPTVLLLP